VEQDRAALLQTQAHVAIVKARVRIATADLDSAKSAVARAEALGKSAAATLKFREVQYTRLKALRDRNSIDETTFVESKLQYDASIEDVNAAKAGVTIAKSQVVAAMGKLEEAEADIGLAEANVRIARVRLDQSQGRLGAAAITAPFDGVITQTGYSVGELIQPSQTTPIVTIQRTDLMRVVATVPERDVPLVKAGQIVDMEIDVLPGQKLSAKVSRIGVALDPKIHAMRVEIDLPNPDGRIRAGMHATIAIRLSRQTEA